jgi:hypothetical protein
MSIETSANVRAKAAEIIKSGASMAPNEFLTALAFASGSLIAACWPPESREACLEAHEQSVRDLVEIGSRRLREKS